MNKIYACSDLHGNLSVWNSVKNYLNDNDELIYLGDAIDRGENGLEIMLDLLKDNRITYLIGNHEEMMLDALKEEFGEDISYYSAMLWYQNGGNTTASELALYDINFKKSLYEKISKLKSRGYIEYKNKNNQLILLSHAGGTYEQFKNPINLTNWDREHIDKPWDGPDEEIFIVHGHTPVQYLLKENYNPKIYKYCDNHKIDIDMGCFWSNTTCLLDLDTLEPIYLN